MTYMAVVYIPNEGREPPTRCPDDKHLFVDRIVFFLAPFCTAAPTGVGRADRSGLVRWHQQRCRPAAALAPLPLLCRFVRCSLIIVN